jgi:hypothetical protein
MTYLLGPIAFGMSGQAERLHSMTPAREQLAAWMIAHGFATGHGDTFEDLLKELEWQIAELRARGGKKGKDGGQ